MLRYIMLMTGIAPYAHDWHCPIGTPPKMTKSELIAKLAEHYSQLTTKDAEAAVKTIQIGRAHV